MHAPPTHFGQLSLSSADDGQPVPRCRCRACAGTSLGLAAVDDDAPALPLEMDEWAEKKGDGGSGDGGEKGCSGPRRDLTTPRRGDYFIKAFAALSRAMISSASLYSGCQQSQLKDKTLICIPAPYKI